MDVTMNVMATKLMARFIMTVTALIKLSMLLPKVIKTNLPNA